MATAIAALLLAVVALARVRRGKVSPRLLVGALAAGSAWTVLVVGWLGPSLPVRVMTPIREGFSLHHLQEVTGRELDTGALRDALWLPLLARPPVDLRDAVTIDLIFAGLSVVAFAATALATVRWRPLGVALAVGYAGSPLVTLAGTAEVNAPLVALHLLLAALLWAVAVDREEAAPVRALALLGAGLLAWLAVHGRTEVALVPALAVVALGGRLVAPGLDERLPAVAGRALRRFGWVLVPLLGAWLLLAWRLSDYEPVRVDGEAGWLVQGLHPLNPHALTLPIALVATMSPGVVLLALRGGAWALVRPLRTALLPVAVGVLYATMRVAAHGATALVQDRALAPWELYRYLLVLAPLVGLLALPGAVAWQGARWRWVLVALCLVPAVPEARHLLRLEHEAAWPRLGGLSTSAAEEVRRLLARAEAAPDCAIVTPALRWEGGGGPRALRWAALRPVEGGWAVVRSELPATVPAADAVRALVPDVPCGLAWRSLDCAALGLGGCPGLDGLPLVEAWRLPHVPDVHPQHRAAWPADVELSWLEVPGWPVGR